MLKIGINERSLQNPDCPTLSRSTIQAFAYRMESPVLATRYYRNDGDRGGLVHLRRGRHAAQYQPDVDILLWSTGCMVGILG